MFKSSLKNIFYKMKRILKDVRVFFCQNTFFNTRTAAIWICPRIAGEICLTHLFFCNYS